ncbi:PxKF domain-containing protein [Micromonospora sp. SL4-19]|uniref:PxKF domain-containing protein n=1 Tax=Micromonospora sp. SL4-19 TaxID=3399129 RepID=UPI003A4DC7D4
MRTRFRPPPVLRRVAGATLTVTLAAQAAGVPVAFAADAAAPLPRVYRVDSVTEVPDVEFTDALLALSADGTTAVHLSPHGDDSPLLVATNFQTGAKETVGLDLEGQPVPRVAAVAVSGNGRTVAFLATGNDAAELHLPVDVDPNISSAIFVRDRLTRATTWVPVPDLGVPASRHALTGIALSEDGRRLAAEVALPLPKYAGVTSPEGVLVATLAADTAPAVRIVGPEDLVAPGRNPADAEPEVRGFALSGDGAVLAVNAYRDSTPVMLRFKAATGDRMTGDRELTGAQQAAWVPNLDHTGRRTAFGKAGAGVVVADLAAGPPADVTLTPANPVPYVSGDVEFGPADPPTDARLSADGGTVAFVRAGALWAQPVRAGQAARLASPGLDGRIAEPLSAEARYPDAAYAPAVSGDGSVLGFLSASTAFVAPRTEAPQPSHLYRSVPADLPAPTWPEGATLTAEPGTTTVTVKWPAASGTVTAYEVSADGAAATTVDAPTTQAVLSDLAAGATVQIAVVAKDAAGRASAPLAVSVTLRDDLPPGDAPLSALAGPGARVRLQWERSNATGVTGYRVLRDGVKLADLAADANTYVDNAVAADTSYRYAVALLRGAEEFPLTKDATVRTAAMSVSEAAWNWPRVTGTAYLAPGRAAAFALVGAAGFAASADLTVRTADNPAERIRIELQEQEPGTYTGSWPVATGVLAVTSAVLHLGDGVGNTLDRPASGLPAQVGGLLRADVKATGGEPAGVRLQVWSDATHSGTLRVLDRNGLTEIPVAPAADHQITTTRTDGLAGTPRRDVEVGSGQVIDLPLGPSVPATATVFAKRADGFPMTGTRITLDTPSGPRAGTTDSRGRAIFTGLDAASRVTATADLPADVLAAQGLGERPSRELTLTAGDNEFQLVATALPKARLTGTTKTPDGRPVPYVQLQVSQALHGTGLSYATKSGADGTWSVEVLGGIGTATQVRTAGVSVQEAEVMVGSEPPAPVHIVVPTPDGFAFAPSLTVKLLDAEPVRQELDWNTADLFRAKLTWGTRSLPAVEHMTVSAPPNTPVRFCADGIRSGLPTGCAEALTSGTDEIPLNVTLEEQARFTARILEPNGTPFTGRYQVSLAGPVAFATQAAGSDLSVSAPAAGTYTLTVNVGGERRLQRQVQAVAGRITDLGELRLSSGSRLLDARSGLVIVDEEVVPGGLAELRAQIVYADATDHGTVRVGLPDGVTVEQVLRDDALTDFTVEDGRTLVVPLAAAESRTVRIFARTPQSGGAGLAFPVSVTGRSGTETLGSVLAFSGYVSIATSGASPDGQVPVSGRAPAGAEVVVRDGGQEVTRTTATSGGLWRARLDLGVAGDEVSRHVLRAEVSTPDRLLVSQSVDVVVDPHAAVIESVTIQQTGGRVITFRPAEGVARFPYTYASGQPVTVTARFTGEVSNASARVGRISGALAVVPGERHTYRAVLNPTLTQLGDVFIDFEPVISRPVLPVPPRPDTPETLFDSDNVTLSEPVVNGSTVTQSFTAPTPRLGPNARATVTMTVTRLQRYEPSDAAARRAGAAGVRAFEALLVGESPDVISKRHSWNASMAAIVDLTSLREAEPTALTKTLATLGFIDGAARFGFEMLFVNVTNADQMYGFAESGGKYRSIEQLFDMAAQCHDAELANIYRDRAQILARQALMYDVFSDVTWFAGLFLTPATFGLSAFAMWAAPWVMGKLIEYDLGEGIDHLRREIAQDPQCPRETDVSAPINRLTDITWTHDPSGFAYEGLEDRRVEGVTATLLQAPSSAGPWSVWRAEEFDQTNPQSTTTDGRYGWDVPEGWWKVVYTEDGYLPTESRVLRVLPPHTDVNVNLVRADLAEVDKVEADQDGLTVTFTQPMRANQVLDGLTVTTPDGDPVGGRWTAVSRRAPVGHPLENAPLATTFRFAGEKRSGKVTVVVDELVQDHVGRAVAEGTERTLTVDWHGPDAVPPQVSVTGVADGGVYHLKAVPTAGCRTVDEGSGVATEATLTVTGGTAAGVGVYTVTCAGAVDKAGNLAAPVSVGYTTAYVFDGFSAPVKNGDGFNKAKAGQAIPIKWRLTDATGAPVTNLAAAPLSVVTADCATARTLAAIEEYASDASGLQNLGNGYYQVNWKTPKTYAGTCQKLRVELGEGPAVAHTALFQFAA